MIILQAEKQLDDPYNVLFQGIVADRACTVICGNPKQLSQ